MITNNQRLLTAICGITFFLGFESGGFQLSLRMVGKEFALSNAEMGGLVAAQFLAITLMPLCFGQLSDRIGKKNVLCRFVPVFIVGCFVAACSNSAFVFIVGAVIIGAGYSVCECLASAALSDAFPDKAQQCLNLTQCTFSLGGVTSPLLVSWAIQNGLASWRAVFWLAGIGYLLVYPLLFFSKFCSPCSQAHEENKSIRLLFSSAALPLLTVVMLLYVGIENGTAYFADSLFTESLGSEQSGAYAIAAFWAAMTLSRMLFSVIRVKPSHICVMSFGVCAMLALLLALEYKDIPLCVGLYALLGFAQGPVWPMIVALGTRLFPQFSGTLSSILMVGGGLGGALSPVAMGLVADRCGVGGAFVFLGGISIAAGILMILFVRWNTQY